MLWGLAFAVGLHGRGEAGFLGLRAEKAAEPNRAAWSYSQHGADWPGECQEQGQSPIDLPPLATTANASTRLFFRFPPGGYEEPVTLYNDGYLISATFGHDKKLGGIGVGSSFANLDKSWSLQQMTLHAPSEHTWGGTHLPAELQLVHSGETPEDGLAVVVIGLARGSVQTASVFWDTLMRDGLPEQKMDEKRVNEHYPDRLDFTTVVGNRADLKDTTGSPLVNDESEFPEYYMYTGSVSVPPCTPGVQYFVRAEPRLVNPERLDMLMTTVSRMGQPDGNYRITQPLANRSVVKLAAENAEALQSEEELRESVLSPTQSPVVNITEAHGGYDPSHEDAVAETEAQKLSASYSDPTKFTVAEQQAKADNVPSVVAAFPHQDLIDDPNAVAMKLTMVTSSQAEVAKQREAVTQAELEYQNALNEQKLAQQARDYSEGYDNLTVAETQLLTAQDAANGKKMVVESNQKKLETLTNTLDEAKAHAQAITDMAKRQVEQLGNSSAGGVGTGAISTHFTLPTGSAADPFTRHNAETVSRITEQPLPRHLGPGLGPNHPALWGTVPILPTSEQDEGVEVDTEGGNDEVTTDEDGIPVQPQPAVETMATTA